MLSEASFHSNPAEERRLGDPEYNRREARALFAGLARYALGGVPRMRMVKPTDRGVPTSGPAQVVIDLDDGLRTRKSWGYKRRMIFKDSVVVRVGDARWPFTYDDATDRVTVSLPAVRSQVS